jgi:hypothetical protein
MKKPSTVRQLLGGLGLTATISAGCGSGGAVQIGNPPAPDAAADTASPDVPSIPPDAGEDLQLPR